MKLRLSALALGATCWWAAPAPGAKGRSDPLEGFNRSMYNFNYNVLDPYVVRPVAVAWRDYVPQPARNGLSNFTSNLEEPAVMVNYFLQGDPYQGMVHFTRFFLNSILGMGGFIDVAGMANRNCSVNSRTVSAARWDIMASGMVRMCSYRSTVVSPCVMMAAIWWIRCIRCCRG
jgi:ABC-type transporter lipoprotein component MlaA